MYLTYRNAGLFPNFASILANAIPVKEWYKHRNATLKSTNIWENKIKANVPRRKLPPIAETF